MKTHHRLTALFAAAFVAIASLGFVHTAATADDLVFAKKCKAGWEWDFNKQKCVRSGRDY